MDIEGLTKSQIVLLTLLVSFVTSIATGIVTVTLLAQAPPAVTQTINRVVERTVERVVPSESQNANVVTTEKTVVVRESDIITESIEKNAGSLVRITKVGGGPNGENILVGIGVLVSRGGIVATDSSLVTSPGTYTVATSKGKAYSAAVLDDGAGKTTALLRITQEDATQPDVFAPVVLGTTEGPIKLGQTVISLSGGERTNVALGIVAGLDTEPMQDNPEETVLRRIKTDISQSRLLFGSPLIDVFGNVVGIHTVAAQGGEGLANFVPAASISGQVFQFVETGT